MLQHSLVDNPLTEDPDDCRAQVQAYKRKRVEDIVSQITIPGSILKETECVAVINAFFKAIATNLEAGVGFESDYLTLTQSIAGVFTDAKDRFDPSRHEVKLNLRIGDPLKEALRQVRVKKVTTSVALPELTQIHDWKSRSIDQLLTAGHSAQVTGNRLKIDNMDDPQQGVFLVNTKKEEEIRIPYLHQNTAKKLQLEWPDSLKSGNTYKLEVRTTIKGGQEVRTGVSTSVLQVK